MTGEVKWWDDKKGLGFITGDDGNDYFVHYSSVICNGRKTLVAKESVKFDTLRTEKGDKATNVVPMGGKTPA